MKRTKAFRRYAAAEMSCLDSGRNRPWKLVKVSWTLRVPEETEHVINLLSLHFGISKNAVAVHAVNRVWSEVLDTLHPEDLQEYERRLKAAKLWRLKRDDAKARRLRAESLKGIDEAAKKLKEKQLEEQRERREELQVKSGFERFVDAVAAKERGRAGEFEEFEDFDRLGGHKPGRVFEGQQQPPSSLVSSDHQEPKNGVNKKKSRTP